MKILFAASEAVPFCKTGGLADVCTALPKALRRRGHDVRLVIPRYWSVDREKYGLRWAVTPLGVEMGNELLWAGVWQTEYEGLPVYFVEYEQFFGRAGLYDDGRWAYFDNAIRFGFFSKACVQLCRDLNFQPDVIHANDWQTALIPVYLKTSDFNDPFFFRTASVFSVHNIAFQGVFPASYFPFLGLAPDNFTPDRMEAFQGVNFMKGAIFYADALSTVSPSYAQEILSEPGGNGLSAYLERRRHDLKGILNGVDDEHWNPESDPLIPARYSARDLSGKAVCKRALQKEFLLEVNDRIPVIGVVSRFTHQKGLQLLVPVIHEILKNMAVQFVFLGSGEKALEDFFGGLPARYPGRVGAWIGHNNHKAHLIEAGSDFFLMPSLFEPCGLNQMYSLRYGTPPIVRETGGLRDTVEQYDEKKGSGTGFRFHSPDANAVYYTIGWAVSTYYDRPDHLEAMRRRGMALRFSWDESASRYETLYENALERRHSWA